jgi:hypothetical protein
MSRIDHLYWEEEWEAQKGSTKGNKKQGAKKGKQWSPLISDCAHWRQPFDLEDGLRVYASAWMDQPRQAQVVPAEGFSGDPDVGFYLDSRWGSDLLLVSPGTAGPFTRGRRSNSKVVVFPWPDYGVPRDTKVLLRCLKWLLKQIQDGRTVEVGCMGGHGRTGSVLAALLVGQGLTPEAAIRRVWRRYCQEAIESQQQIAFLRSLS